MKKFTNLLGYALLLNLLGFIALLAYRVNFDISATLGVVYAFAYSASTALIDFSSIDLLKGLQWFAVLMYLIASLLLVFISIKKLNLLRIIVSPTGLIFSLSIVLITINGYYPDAVGFDNLGAKSDFWSLILLPLEVANSGLQAIAFSGLIVSAVLLTVIFHIFVLADSVRNPYGKKQGLMMPILKEETIIAEELSKFVIPNQIKISSLSASSSPSSFKPSSPTQNHSLLNPTPIVVLPPAPSLPEKLEISQARQTVLQLKEKIRDLIRLQLLQAKQSMTFPTPTLIQPTQVTLPPIESVGENTPVVQENKPLEEPSKLIQQQVNEAIATEIALLEPKSKDRVTTLINEELIKYDSLNREVMESLVAEKIEQQIGNAIEQYKQEVVLMVEKSLNETKIKEQTTLVASTPLAVSNEELQLRIQQTLEQNPIYKKIITLGSKSEEIGDTTNSSQQSIQEPGLSSTDVINLIQNHTLTQLQIQQMLEAEHQKLATMIQQIPKQDLSHLLTKDQFNQISQQLTQTKQDLIQQHQDIMAMKDVLSQFQLETLGRIEPLQERLQQYESNKVANTQINPVEESFIVALMQKHQSTLKPHESLEVISSMVANEVKKQTSEGTKLTVVEVERMIAEAVGRNPQPAAVVMPDAMSEEAITRIVEAKLPKAISEEEINRMVDSKLPKQGVGVMNESVISSMVANEVKKQTSEGTKLTVVEVERMIAEAIGRNPQQAAVVMPDAMSEEAITRIVEAKLPKAISEEEINRMVDSRLPKQGVGVMNESVISSMVANEVKKQTSEGTKLTVLEVERMIAEAVARLPKQVYIQENTSSNSVNTNSSYNSRIVSPVLTIPVIRKKNAKAPENEKRADQFKSVITPEVGTTRTGKKKIVRIPFQERMRFAEPLLLAHYDELKNYILSFQVKSRISNAGDIFRLHKEEYVKITIAGKGLKLYMALNPEDYKDGPIPVDDASDKKMYKEIPLVFKVKSELSLKRAKKLIDDLMMKKGLPQQEIPFLPWSKAFQK
jgi:hypothetical protein